MIEAVLTVKGREWISANDRGSWHRRAKLTKEWRDAAGWVCRSAKLPKLEQAHIVAFALVPDKRRRDSANLSLTAKAVVDGLVDAGLLLDDDHTRLAGPDMRIRLSDVKVPTLELWIEGRE